MKKYLETKFSLEKLTSEWQNPDSNFYFAKENETIIGYLKLNTAKAQTELQDPNALEIERIYVIQAFHGKKVGQLLLDFALKKAKQNDNIYIWLGVWEENHRAIRFYSKNGFVVFDKHIFMMGNDAQTDYLMKKEL